MQAGWDARRRNRNVGTRRRGHGKDNRLVIPYPRNFGGHFAERLTSYRTVTRPVWGRDFSVLVEPTRLDVVHACTPDDVFRMLELIPAADRQGIDFLILRQPRRKEEVLSSCWGRLRYFARVGRHEGPAIILEATDLSRPRRWTRSLRPDAAAELDRLRADGHRVETTRREHVIHIDLDSARSTQLYRTLPHEVGHWVQFVRRVERPTDGLWRERYEAYQRVPTAEKEAFAHGYADRLRARLLASGAIPFPRVIDPARLRAEGLRGEDFVLV